MVSSSWQTNQEEAEEYKRSFLARECEHAHTQAAHVLPVSHILTHWEGTSAAQVLRVLPSPVLILSGDPYMEGCVSAASSDSFWFTFVEATNWRAGTFPSCQGLGLTSVPKPTGAGQPLGGVPLSLFVLSLWLLRRGPVCVPSVVSLLERRPPWPDMATLPVSSLILWEREHHCLMTTSAMAVQLDLSREARFFPWFDDVPLGKCLQSHKNFMRKQLI